MERVLAHSLCFASVLSVFFAAHPARAADCGSSVQVKGAVITVLPTGGDDTANLQCAFATAGTATTAVRLIAGEYHTGNLFITGFRGSFSGAGADQTVVTNGAMQAIAADFFMDDPGPTNPWPILLTFKGGHFQVRDLAIAIRGAGPAWSLPGIPFALHSIISAALVFGEVDAEFLHLGISGEPAPDDPLIGYNLYNGIYFERPAVLPASGRFSVHDSSFASLGSWAPVAGLQSAAVNVQHNQASDVGLAFDIVALSGSKVLYANNTIEDYLMTVLVGPLDSTSLSLIGNVLEGGSGIAVEMSFSNGSTCALLGNTISSPDPGILLGADTSRCTVAGNHGANVVDLGTGNHVAGQ